MKNLFKLKNILICIGFAVLLLFLKDNISALGNIFSTIIGVLMPFAIGFLIAYILNFPYKFIETKIFGRVGTKRKALAKLKKPLSIILTYLFVVALFVVLVWIIVPQIAENISSLAESMPGYFRSLQEYINYAIGWLNSTFNAGIDENNILNDISNQMIAYITSDDASDFAANAGNFLVDMFSNTATGVYNFVMGVIISVYFLSAKNTLCRQVKKLAVAFIPMKHLPKVYEIVDITDTKCGRFLVGDIIDAAVVGVLHWVVLSIIQIPYAPLIAVLVGITNIIPFFGPFIGSIPSAFILLLVNPWDMIWFLVVNIIIQQIDGNFLKPRIIGGQVGLSSFWVLFSVVVGGALFGMMGLILGTPIFAVIYYLLRKRANNKISEKGKAGKGALEFEVLNYSKIAEEQKRIRAEKENQQSEKLRRLMHREKASKSGEDENSDGDIPAESAEDDNGDC